MPRKATPIILTILLLLSLSCGKKTTEVYGAPKTKYEAGIIASCMTKSMAQEITLKEGGSFRTLSEDRKLIEFRNIDEDILKKYIAKRHLQKNTFFDAIVEGESASSLGYIQDYPFEGNAAPSYRNTIMINEFPHLRQIDADSLPSNLNGEGVVIAIIDTGVSYNHPDLSPNIFTNNGNLIGYDFVNNDRYPVDDHGHGTHVAGLAAGTKSGVAMKAKIMPVKVLNASGAGDIGTIAQGILYAINNGAHIINLSLGGIGSRMAQADINNLLSKVRIAKDNGKLIVAAAGNGGDDGIGDCNDSDPTYPSSFNESNLISVAAVNSFNNLTYYSNFGERTVHLAAPGGNGRYEGLQSTAISYKVNGKWEANYTTMSGTSMATPVVSGVAALVKSKTTSLTPSQIKTHLMETGTSSPSLQGLISSGKVVNARRALGI